MRFRISRFIAVLFAVGVLAMASVPSLLAAGSGPNDATSPSAQWVSIPGKTSQWYVFRDEGDRTPISVRMQAGKGVSFAIYTPNNLRQPVGRGTPNRALKNDLFWTGSFNISGNYYVVVRNNNATESGYRLSISGPKVSFPVAAQAPVTTVPSLPLAKAAPSSNSQNYTVDGQVRMLNKGDVHVYSFNYDGKGGQILVNLVDQPFGTASFEVWTPEEWATHTQPIGRGSPDVYVGRNSLVWSGNFNAPGIYHIVVRHTRQSGAASYVLHVSGPGVSH